LNPKYRAAEIRQVLEDSQPCVLITRTRIEDRDYVADLERLSQAIGSLRRVLVFDGDPVPRGAEPLAAFLATQHVSAAALRGAQARVRPDDPCILVYTSGSTGSPKGALLAHTGILRFCARQNEVWPVRPQRTLNYFPINHVGSIVDNALPCLAGGGTVVFMEAFDAAEAVRLTERWQLTLVGSVPSALQLQMATAEYGRANWSALQLLVWEGAAMPVEVIEQLLQLGCPLATNYNMTEASAITVLEPTRAIDLLAGTVGAAYPGVTIRLLTGDGAEASGAEPGEVWVKSEMNFKGYWNQPAATASVFSDDGYFRTGDVAVRRPDGRYRLVGRVKEMFKSGGYNVYSREVEAALEEFPAVLTAVVVPQPDPLWQEVGVAFVVPREGMSLAGLEEWVKQRLANYKRPKRYVVQGSLPLLPIGKVDRAALRRLVTTVGDRVSA
jgi:acyl-CoA synthetase (AMP-forming)/AMP-acid ligase II